MLFLKGEVMGKIIAIEGIDCSGKETQTKLLKDYLINLGYKVKTFSFPNYNKATGKIIGGSFLGNQTYGEPLFLEGASHVDPKVGASLFALDRYYSKDEIEEALKEFDYILFDRSTYSNMAFQGAKYPIDKQKEFFTWIETLEFNLYGFPKPDIFFWIDMPIKEVEKLLQNRNFIDENEKDLEYLENVRDTYQRLVNIYEGITINCVIDDKLLSPSKIALEIQKFL